MSTLLISGVAQKNGMDINASNNKITKIGDPSGSLTSHF